MMNSPPICALKAIPGMHIPLLAEAPTWPAQRVPCLKEKRIIIEILIAINLNFGIDIIIIGKN